MDKRQIYGSHQEVKSSTLSQRSDQAFQAMVRLLNKSSLAKNCNDSINNHIFKEKNSRKKY